MTDKEFFSCAVEVSTEFDKYILSHPEIVEEIPQDALLVFFLEEEPEFNKKSVEFAQKHREPNQPLVAIKAQKLLPPFESRLVNPHIEPIPTL